MTLSKSMKRALVALIACAAGGALSLGMALPAQAATSYSVSITPVQSSGTCYLFVCSLPATTSVKYYATAGAQMKSVVITNSLSELGGSVLLANTKTSTNSNYASFTFSVPSGHQHSIYAAKITAKFTTTAGAVTSKSTTKNWSSPIG